MRLSESPLIGAEAIRRRVAELSVEINRDLDGQDVLLLVVLKGSLVFAADLMRELTAPVTIDFIRAQSYDGTASQGEVQLAYLPEEPIAKRQVVLVEDILDTGRTCRALLDWLAAQQPASVRLCTLLDKPSRRMTPVTADYTGFVIDAHFVVGYGLDYEQRYRQLPAIHVLEESLG